MTPETAQRRLAKPAGAALCRYDEDVVAVDGGWIAIVDELATEIERFCAATAEPLPTVLQMKEKLGTLRFYVTGTGNDM